MLSLVLLKTVIHRENDNENHHGDSDCILFSSVNSMCDNILGALHTCSPFITQQKV